MNSFTSFDQMLNAGFWFGLKYLYIIALLLYLIFTIIVTRQIKLMSQTIIGPSAKWLIPGSFLYVALAIFCLFLLMIIL